jgi:SAM-dependent methyltransferase
MARVYAARDARDFGGRYDYADPANLFAIHDRERRLLAALRANGLDALSSSRVLEIGCGTGFWLRSFVQWGVSPSRIVGLELDERRAQVARLRTPRGVGIVRADGARAPFADGTFDVVLQSTVFSSILDRGVRTAVAAEMLRVLGVNGTILWYDFRYNNPRNKDVAGIRLDDLGRLFPGCRISSQSVTLAPPLLRAVAPISTVAARMLSAVPPLRSHLLAFVRR